MALMLSRILAFASQTDEVARTRWAGRDNFRRCRRRPENAGISGGQRKDKGEKAVPKSFIVSASCQTPFAFQENFLPNRRKAAMLVLMSQTGKFLLKLDDKQSERDHRELRIDKVGVAPGCAFPSRCVTKAQRCRHHATIGMFVICQRSSKART